MKRPGVLIVIFVGALLMFITFNTIVTESEGSRGLEAGDELPPFAMPLSTSPCRGRCDANVATGEGQGAAGARPACAVRGPEILNVCELREAGPFVLAFVFHPVDRCRAQLPVLERVAARHRGLRFRVIAVRANAAEARGLKSNLPVGYDNDGAVANEYAVVVCPTITYVAAGGRVVGSTVGSQTEAQVEEWVRRIE
ncbi:TlpA family protein disulfide reductase [Solirubrobacter sp. CPCC 204708]|uniref:TlpA family protein disulfide reductase n=1 Tax=Solirubrobacter deserti TaxID=2282478 RepID=A0ABT4RG55_9ACTN|nr:TlpA disulfide reductase family protein [Solirubrobacter deserti]MBE2318226.1 TlpA family protein disulfide reductase [Solirubrobacter deserti]MDA0137507.1 TlpA family protein disulfide reductase [Solirubrobacter deserti]